MISSLNRMVALFLSLAANGYLLNFILDQSYSFFMIFRFLWFSRGEGHDFPCCLFLPLLNIIKKGIYIITIFSGKLLMQFLGSIYDWVNQYILCILPILIWTSSCKGRTCFAAPPYPFIAETQRVQRISLRRKQALWIADRDDHGGLKQRARHIVSLSTLTL